jgi:hypothetical protein
MDDIEDSGSHIVSDIYFAAFLRTMGCKLMRNDRKGKKTLFVFEDTEKLQELKMSYYNRADDVKVIPLEFVGHVKDLKSLCYMS